MAGCGTGPMSVRAAPVCVAAACGRGRAAVFCLGVVMALLAPRPAAVTAVDVSELLGCTLCAVRGLARV